MASRIASLKALLPDLESALRSFSSSPARFAVVHTINHKPGPSQPRTLYILDSSFNPPSIAHLALATAALSQHAPTEPAPCRLLLLFSTHNADKTPSPAHFAQRLALMTAFAEDLSRQLKSGAPQLRLDAEVADIAIDIGLTKEPYYSDKSAAIEAQTPLFYAAQPAHVHLVGYDTLIRFCNPKYYPESKPPLAALRPFFEKGHKLRVTQRPSDEGDESSRGYGSVEEQGRYLQWLREGGQKQEGFEPKWGWNVDMVPGDDSVGVSSTRVRTAARKAEWDEVERLCTEGVAAWIKDQGLYSEGGDV